MYFDIKLVNFEGPLDLLLHLISDNKIDIYDIPIKLITDQYLKIIRDDKNADADSLSDFLVMASTLIEIKSKVLLPSDREEYYDGDENYDDPGSELVEKLLKYRLYKRAACNLEERANFVFTREGDISIGNILEEKKKAPLSMDIDLLMRAFENVLVKIPPKDEKRKEFFHSLKPEIHSVSDKVSEIINLLNFSRSFLLSTILESVDTKIECITYFLAILELIRQNRIRVDQSDIFDDISVIKTDSCNDFENYGENLYG